MHCNTIHDWSIVHGHYTRPYKSEVFERNVVLCMRSNYFQLSQLMLWSYLTSIKLSQVPHSSISENYLATLITFLTTKPINLLVTGTIYALVAYLLIIQLTKSLIRQSEGLKQERNGKSRVRNASCRKIQCCSTLQQSLKEE